jgi:hypothetical protein
VAAGKGSWFKQRLGGGLYSKAGWVCLACVIDMYIIRVVLMPYLNAFVCVHTVLINRSISCTAPQSRLDPVSRLVLCFDNICRLQM